ncbi:MAG: hypothetical protein V9E81_04685 [Marmoricola sp.]
MKLRMSLAAPVAAMALALSALAGCGESTDTGGATTVGPLDPNKKVEITWWHGQSAEAAKILGDLAREYEKDHPNVTIKDSAGASTTDELLTKMQAGFASRHLPRCVLRLWQLGRQVEPVGSHTRHRPAGQEG